MTLLKVVKKDLKSDEGWREKGYLDHLGVPTIGYGFTWLEKEEGDFILNNRVQSIYNTLYSEINYFDSLPNNIKRALINMAYQMGIDGLMNFRKTLAFIRDGEYEKAADEALKSRWAAQTPERAKRVTDWMRAANDPQTG